MNQKNPTKRVKQEHEDSGHAVYRSWCAACVEGRGVGDQHRIELLLAMCGHQAVELAAVILLGGIPCLVG